MLGLGLEGGAGGEATTADGFADPDVEETVVSILE
jgi:hypothetical protein